MKTQDAESPLPCPSRARFRQLLIVSLLLIVWTAFLIWQAVDP